MLTSKPITLSQVLYLIIVYNIVYNIIYNIVYNIENSFKAWNFNPYLTETYIGFDDSDIFLGYIPKCPLQRKFCSK